MDGCQAVLCDGNISIDLLNKLSIKADEMQLPFIYEPTSIIKSVKVLDFAIRHTCMITPNVYELCRMISILKNKEVDNNNDLTIDQIIEMGQVLLQSMKSQFACHVIVIVGRRGVVAISRSMNQEISSKHYPLSQEDLNIKVINSNGAGDTMVATIVAGHYIKGYDLDVAIQAGMHAATFTFNQSQLFQMS